MWNANVQNLTHFTKISIIQDWRYNSLIQQTPWRHTLNLNFGFKNYVSHNINIIATDKTLTVSTTKLFNTLTYRTQRKRQVKRHRETINLNECNALQKENLNQDKPSSKFSLCINIISLSLLMSWKLQT